MGLAMEPSLRKGALSGGALSTDALGLRSWKNWFKVTQVSPTSKHPAQGSFHTRVLSDCLHHPPAANGSHSNLLVLTWSRTVSLGMDPKARQQQPPLPTGVPSMA